jgi:hypothetical protein
MSWWYAVLVALALKALCFCVGFYLDEFLKVVPYTLYNMSRRLIVSCALGAFACTEGSPSAFSDADAGSAGAREDAPVDEQYSDFPSAPILDAIPQGATDLTGALSTEGVSAPPCLVQPEPDTLYPRNWLRPRFQWNGPEGAIFALEIAVSNQRNVLRVFTTAKRWTMPKAMWSALATNSAERPLNISLRTGTFDQARITAVSKATRIEARISSTSAPGSIVFWGIDGTGASAVTAIKGFQPGDESVTDILRPAQVKQKSSNCIGCHVGSPDGEHVLFSAAATTAGAYFGISSVKDKPGNAPPFLSLASIATLESAGGWGLTATSKAHWTPGNYSQIVSNGFGQLRWINLAEVDGSKNTAILARQGDTGIAFSPSWSASGDRIVYSSMTKEIDSAKPETINGGIGGTDGNLRIIPFSAHAGGVSVPVPGASDAKYNEYYPAFSSDDALIAYSRAEQGGAYFNPAAEIMVVPSSGGTAVRLTANDPPLCTGLKSPGVTNSWPKWAPTAALRNGERVYWLTFSSTRFGRSQLVVSAVVTKDSAIVRTHGSVHLWNQSENEGNHTPAWDYTPIIPR